MAPGLDCVVDPLRQSLGRLGTIEAQLAVKGEYFQTGEKLVQRRRKDVTMNSEVRRPRGEKAESDE